MANVVIQFLEVHLQVEGDDDRAVFTRMFNDHINRWQRLYCETQARRRLADSERRLTGPQEDDNAG
jgi:hypothetical protein